MFLNKIIDYFGSAFGPRNFQSGIINTTNLRGFVLPLVVQACSSVMTTLVIKAACLIFLLAVETGSPFISALTLIVGKLVFQLSLETGSPYNRALTLIVGKLVIQLVL